LRPEDNEENHKSTYFEIPEVDLIEKRNIFKALDEAKDETQEAFYKSLQPSLSKKTLINVYWYYYLVVKIVLLQWYAFFYCVQYPSTKPTNKYLINPIRDNAALITFYILCSAYLIIQAF